jgi:hypothetical protein
MTCGSWCTITAVLATDNVGRFYSRINNGINQIKQDIAKKAMESTIKN